MITHNICFCGEIRKILCGYPRLSVAMYKSSMNSPLSKLMLTIKFWPIPNTTQHHSTHTRKIFHIAQDIVISIYLGGGWVVRRCCLLTSPGRPTDIDLQLGKACYPCSR